MDQKELQLPDTVSLPHPNRLLIIEPLDYPNPYNFHQAHRHDYFEIILVKSGHGFQIIDFNQHDMHAGQLYTIYPGQIHLMERKSAEGMIIQFRKNIFDLIHPIKHSHLYFTNPAFNADKETFLHLYSLTESIWVLLQQEELSSLSIHKAYSYLQILLITLIEQHSDTVTLQGHQVVVQFISLLAQYIKSKKKVADYCELINCSPDKLNLACKNSLGKTALKLIHEELILEIRRMMLLNQLSLKEIAYELNFDSPANFSGFIKSCTGLTPTALQSSILNKIYA